jgi:hypothetical protein
MLRRLWVLDLRAAARRMLRCLWMLDAGRRMFSVRGSML